MRVIFSGIVSIISETVAASSRPRYGANRNGHFDCKVKNIYLCALWNSSHISEISDVMYKKKLKTGLAWAVAIAGYYVWFQTFYNSMRYGKLFPYSDLRDMAIGVSYNFFPILAIFLLNMLIVFRIVNIKDLKLKICADVILSITLACMVNWLYLLILGSFRDAEVDWAGTILNDILIILGVEMVYYFRRLSKARKETEEARLQAVQYRYDALKSQINPHFLFNSLNLLYSLVSIDTVRSKLFIRELSRMYRYIMAQQNRERVSVAEEFDFLASYVSVLEMRYNNKFRVRISGCRDNNRSLIPFTMQLLIENVTKHNAITSKSPMTVSIDISDSEITISNPIYPRETESVSNIGLRYLTQLYASQGKNFHVEKCDGHFTAHVPLI